MTNILTRAQVRANREKVIAFLRNPELEKANGVLDKGDGVSRCCLGHMCAAMEIKSVASLNGHIGYGEKIEYYYAPSELIDAVGLKNKKGSVGASIMGTRYHHLARVNDDSDKQPADFADYLESVIEGGPNSPWHALDHYPEEIAA